MRKEDRVFGRIRFIRRRGCSDQEVLPLVPAATQTERCEAAVVCVADAQNAFKRLRQRRKSLNLIDEQSTLSARRDLKRSLQARRCTIESSEVEHDGFVTRT